MLAAENPSVDRRLASPAPTRRARDMDCKSGNQANKKLIQARLPFKRLNPEQKDNQPPKRPCAAPRPEPAVPDRETETELSPSPLGNGPPLVNGRGPLDGFIRRSRPSASDENMVIDLTEDSSLSPSKVFATPAAVSTTSSPCLSVKDKQNKDKSTSSSDKTEPTDCKKVDGGGEGNEEMNDSGQSISQLDLTQYSESESEDLEETANISSLGDTSVMSPSSPSSTSESSPEPTKSRRTPSSTPTEPKTTPRIPADQKAVKRRSLKNLEEQEERLRLRQEKERQREEAKAAKEKKKEEARKQREEREREKREKKEKDERERREKKEKEEKEKADRLKAKEELRKSKMEAKLEEKRKKEEEKRMKEEEKRLKEEKDRIKAEKGEITRFLQKSKIQQAPKTLAAACGKFAPFEIKDNMCLAPLCRVQCDLEELDQYLLNPVDNITWKDWIREKPRRSGSTKPREMDPSSECTIMAEGASSDSVPDRERYGPMKLLQFHSNHRPAYWGTWSKKSAHISPRCPLRKDTDILDYEVDSDEEWEEEEPGESLSHSEGEDEEEGGEDDDEDDDGFFVPHGYLSDGEGALEDEEGGDLEKQKLRQTLKAREWDELMSTKKKMKVLQPVVKGCIWEGEGPAVEQFQAYAVCLVEPLPKADTSTSPEEQINKSQREEQLLGQLLPLLHGNVNSSKVIITEFQQFCRQQASSSSSSSSIPGLLSPQSSPDNIPTRMHVKRVIKNNAVYEKRSAYKRCCWYVHTDVLSRFGHEALPVPCQWSYLTSGAREEPREEAQAATGSHGNSPTTPQNSSTTPTSSSKRKSTGSMSITKFMMKCSGQKEAMEVDGFQADTEDDEEDCIIISSQNAKQPSNEGDVLMEVAPSSTAAALPVTSATQTLATA